MYDHRAFRIRSPQRVFLRRLLAGASLVFAFAAVASDVRAQTPAADALRRIEHHVERNPTRATRELSEWLATAPSLTDKDQLRIELIRTEIAGGMESSASTLAKVDRLLPRLATVGDDAMHARALALRVRMLDFLNRGAEALNDSAAAFERAGAAGDKELQVEILVSRAGILANRADFAAAYAALAQAERLSREVGTLHAEGNVAYYAAWLASAVGDRPRAVEMFARALAAYRGDEDPSNAADTLVGLGISLIRDRRPAEALAPLDEALRLFNELGDARGAAVAQAPRAVALASAGRGIEAITASNVAMAGLRPHSSGEEMLFALIYRAQAANLLHRSQVALTALDEARPFAEVTENELAHIAYLRELSTALGEAGRHQEAHAALTDLVRRTDAHNELRLSRQLAAQRGQLESQRLEHANDLLRREAEASRQAMAALERAAQLRMMLVVLAGLIVAATLFVLAWQRRVNRRIAVLAATDALTGTFNRRRIGELGDATFAAHRTNGLALSVALLDLDHFKHINDQYGHATGDAALRAVADVLTAHLRAGDSLGRYGGEEFAVILPRATLQEATLIVERLRAAVADLSLAPLGVDGRLTLSAGVAAARATDASFDAVVDRADVALYRAKAAGRNRVQVDAFDAGDQKAA